MIFDLTNKYKVKNQLAEIVSNYKILHWDDYPILFTGSNKFDNIILGSFLEEDIENKHLYYIHTVLDSKEYTYFVNRRLTYLDILKSSDNICLVQSDFSNRVLNSFSWTIQDVPGEYLPSEKSFCPESVQQFSPVFSISLGGLIANFNKAITEKVASIQTNFSNLLEDRIAALKGFDFSSQAFLYAYSKGSFRINLELDIKPNPKKPNLFIELAPVSKYLNEYIRYLSFDFVNEKELFKGDSTDFSDSLTKLYSVFEELYDSSQIPKPKDSRIFFKSDILKALKKFETISENIGQGFDSLQFNNVVDETYTPIGHIGTQEALLISDSLEEIEIAKEGCEEDTDYKDYNIYIYHLNTDTRVGNALIKNLNEEDIMSKPKIKIEGDNPLDQTKYTESIYLNKWINVKAKSRRVGNKFKHLSVLFES